MHLVNFSNHQLISNLYPLTPNFAFLFPQHFFSKTFLKYLVPCQPSLFLMSCHTTLPGSDSADWLAIEAALIFSSSTSTSCVKNLLLHNLRHFFFFIYLHFQVFGHSFLSNLLFLILHILFSLHIAKMITFSFFSFSS